MSGSHRYFDGKVALPRDVALILHGDGLELRDAVGAPLALWPLARLRVVDQNAVSGSFTLRLDPDQGARLEVAAGEDLQRLLTYRPELGRWRGRERRKLLVSFLLWGAVGLAMIGAVYLSWTRAAIIIAGWIPPAWEDKIGEAIQDIATPQPRRCEGVAGLTALRGLVDRLWREHPDQPIKLTVFRDGDPNAFAIPGHRVIVFSGLIDRAKNPEMVAGVLAHELAHVELRHPIRGLVHQIGLGAALALMFGDSSIASMGQLALLLSYSRDMEREADQRGIALLQQAGIRADGMSAFFEEVKKDGLDKLPDFLSTHPDLDERIAATKQPTTGAPAMSEEEWEALKSVCAR